RGRRRNGCDPSGVSLEAVARAPYRDERLRVGGVRLNLLAQPADMHRHGAGVAVKVIAPHTVEQLVAAEYLIGVAGQEPEQVELARGEGDGLSGDADAP